MRDEWYDTMPGVKLSRLNLERDRAVTRGFLERRGVQLHSIEEIQENGDLLGILNQRGSGFYAFVTQGYEREELESEVQLYDPDLKKTEKVPGYIISVQLSSPQKFFYARVKLYPAAKLVEECWFRLLNNPTSLRNSLGRSHFEHGVYRLVGSDLVERIRQVWSDPGKEIKYNWEH